MNKITNLMVFCERLDFIAHPDLPCGDLDNVRVFFGAEDSVQVIVFAGRPGWSDVCWQVDFAAEVPEEVIRLVIEAGSSGNEEKKAAP